MSLCGVTKRKDGTKHKAEKKAASPFLLTTVKELEGMGSERRCNKQNGRVGHSKTRNAEKVLR